MGQASRMIVCAVLGLSACWRGQAAAPAAVEPAAPPPAAPALAVAEMESATDEDRCDDLAFDPLNQVCSAACPQAAAHHTTGCQRLRNQLIAQGYTCGTPDPRSCRPRLVLSSCPAGGCAPIKARITARTMTSGETVLVFGAGSAQGVALHWRATLIDSAGQPLLDGEVRLTRVDVRRSTGVSGVHPTTIGVDVFVLLEP